MVKPFDWFAQEVLEHALTPGGKPVTEQKVSSGSQFIDVTFVPNARHARHLRRLGLLGRMTAAPCLLEPFHQTPGMEEVLECVRKQLTHHHRRVLDAGDRKRPAPEVPWPLWVISSGCWPILCWCN